MALRFEWNERKSRTNLLKHGVGFEDASTVFFDDSALLIDDPEHSQDEDRFVMLGMSSSARLLIVCHCYREDDEVVRIISARKANKLEQRLYRERVLP